MPLSPDITAFGSGARNPGDTNIDIDGAGFGAFAGEVWIFAASDRSGAADQLTVNSWNDLLINVDIPGVLNNATDTVLYLAVQRSDLAWSQSFSFTMGTIAAAFAEFLCAPRLSFGLRIGFS